MDTFLSLTISLCLLMSLVIIYLVWTICRIRQINKQINMHKDTLLSSKKVMMFVPMFLTLSNQSMIVIDIMLFLLFIFLVGLSVFLNELYEKKMKILIEILEEEKNERMESKRSI